MRRYQATLGSALSEAFLRAVLKLQHAKDRIPAWVLASLALPLTIQSASTTSVLCRVNSA